jgi:hypothetical protein
MMHNLPVARIAASLATLALLFGASLVGALTSPADAWQQPYGGCKEAWQAPKSPAADECRDHGWTVTARVVIGPRGVVRFSSLPSCRVEDASSGPVPCSWNLNRERDGNGIGLAFVAFDREAYRYVWDRSPVRGDWRWIAPDMRRTLDRWFGQRDERAGIVWREGVVRLGPTAWVKFPNGVRLAAS